MNFLKNKKFQYGTLAVIVTAAVIAVVIVANVVISMLSSHFGWYVDTSEGLFGFSDESLAMLDRIDKENNKLTVYYCEDENTLSSTTYGKLVLAMTTELQNRYADEDFVTVEFIDDINRDFFKIGAAFGSKSEYSDLFQKMYSEKAFTVGTMIIRNDTYVVGENGEYITNVHGEKQSDYRLSVFSITDLYSESAASFLGDYVFTARISSLCRLSPTAYFLTGHDEMSTAEDGTYGDAEYLVDIFETCGFEIKKLSLSENDFGETTVEPSIAVIFSPLFDYTDAELARLRAFIEKGGNVMMFADSIYRNLDNLNGLLADYGISIASAKFKSGADASVSLGDYTFVAEYVKESPIVARLTDTTGKAVVQDCRVLRVDASKGASPLLLAPSSAVLTGSDTALLGNEAVAAYSAAEGRGSIFVCGADSLASSLVYVPSYTNRDLLLSSMTEMGAEDLPLNLQIETLATDGLDITRGEAITMTVLVSLVPALLFAVAGTVIYIRRKRS